MTDVLWSKTLKVLYGTPIRDSAEGAEWTRQIAKTGAKNTEIREAIEWASDNHVKQAGYHVTAQELVSWIWRYRKSKPKAKFSNDPNAQENYYRNAEKQAGDFVAEWIHRIKGGEAKKNMLDALWYRLYIPSEMKMSVERQILGATS